MRLRAKVRGASQVANRVDLMKRKAWGVKRRKGSNRPGEKSSCGNESER